MPGALNRLPPRTGVIGVWFLAVVALGVYMAPGRTPIIADSFPARYLPVLILEARTFYLDRWADRFAGIRPLGSDGVTPYPLLHIGPHYVSWYPVGAPVVVLPLYVAAAALGVDLHSETRLVTMERISAALVVALSVAVLGLALLRLTADAGWAVALTAIYAFGTSSLSASSQAMWQHGPSQLALATLFWALAAEVPGRGRLIAAGLAAGLAVICRPSDALLVLPVLGVTVWAAAGARPWLALGATAPLGFEVWYRWTYFGTPVPLLTQSADLGVAYFRNAWGAGLIGLLVSPARGLFVYSPVFLLSPVGFLARGTPRWIRTAGVGCALVVAAFATTRSWWGGHSVGPRILADLAPALILGLVPICGRGTRAIVLALGVVSIAAHALAVGWDSAAAWNDWVKLDGRWPGALWDWRYSPLACAVEEVRAGLAAAEAFCRWGAAAAAAALP